MTPHPRHLFKRLLRTVAAVCVAGLVEGISAEAIGEASRRAALDCERIVEVVQ